jgi:hypothetical protein
LDEFIANVQNLNAGEIVVKTRFDTHSDRTAKWFFRNQPQRLGYLDPAIRTVVMGLLHERTGVTKICVREKSLCIKYDKSKSLSEVLRATMTAFNQAGIVLL